MGKWKQIAIVLIFSFQGSVLGLASSIGKPEPNVVLNPLTNRNIRVGGPTYKGFIHQGGWVQHQGTLKQLNLEALRAYHQGNPYTLPYVDGDENTATDDWHCITPLVAFEDTKADLSLNQVEEIRQQLLFVNKPSGLNCVPARDLSIASLSSAIAQQYPGAKPCHRLDRDTSGIVLFGLTPAAHRDASKQFEARTTAKTYTALIAGHPKDDSGTIDLPIGKMKTEEGYNRWAIGGDKARQAVTKWRVLETFDFGGATFSRIELEPKSGRGHQLRLHMIAIGCPILGDTIHAEAGVAVCSPRLCLHATKLQVDWNGVRLEAESISPF